MTKAQKAHQHLLVKVRQGHRTDYLGRTSRKEVAKGEIHVIIGMFPNVKNSNLQVGADSETGLHTNTQANLMMKKKIQHLLQVTFYRMMNGKCKYRTYSRMARPNFS